MKFEVAYTKKAARDLEKLPSDAQRKVINAVERKLFNGSSDYGERLRKSLHGFWKLRVGKYRILYTIDRNRVLICHIGHRQNVYKDRKTLAE